LKCQVGQLKDHFEKLLKVTCSNHTYPIKHKIKVMRKNFMTSAALSKCRRPKEDLGGKDVTPIPEEVAIMTIFS
jgi:hypothetical protein